MPVHDWTRVPAGVFHDFHQSWAVRLTTALNDGLLPSDHYALVGRTAPLTHLEDLSRDPFEPPDTDDESTLYAARANVTTVRHTSDHGIVALIAIVSPGDKGDDAAFARFVRRTVEFIQSGVNVLVIDLFPPQPETIHTAIWIALGTPDPFPTDDPLTVVSYVVGDGVEAYLDSATVGRVLPDMPLFLAADRYVSVPLEATYAAAWAGVPAYWRGVVGGG